MTGTDGMTRYFLGLAVGGVLFLAGCGDDAATFTGECCINGAFYSCGSEAAMGSCSIEGGANACERVSARDSECAI